LPFWKAYTEPTTINEIINTPPIIHFVRFFTFPPDSAINRSIQKTENANTLKNKTKDFSLYTYSITDFVKNQEPIFLIYQEIK